MPPPEPGIRRCVRCDWEFVSPDPERVRRCADCHQSEDGYMPRRAGRIDEAVGFHQWDGRHSG